MTMVKAFYLILVHLRRFTPKLGGGALGDAGGLNRSCQSLQQRMVKTERIEMTKGLDGQRMGVPYCVPYRAMPRLPPRRLRLGA